MIDFRTFITEASNNSPEYHSYTTERLSRGDHPTDIANDLLSKDSHLLGDNTPPERGKLINAIRAKGRFIFNKALNSGDQEGVDRMKHWVTPEKPVKVEKPPEYPTFPEGHPMNADEDLKKISIPRNLANKHLPFYSSKDYVGERLRKGDSYFEIGVKLENAGLISSQSDYARTKTVHVLANRARNKYVKDGNPELAQAARSKKRATVSPVIYKMLDQGHNKERIMAATGVSSGSFDVHKSRWKKQKNQPNEPN